MKWRFSVNVSIWDDAAFVSMFCSVVLKFHHSRSQLCLFTNTGANSASAN
jgi:hypothetical protein